MVGSGDRHGVDILAFENLSKVLFERDFAVEPFLECLAGFARDAEIGVAEADDFGLRHPAETGDVILAAAIHAEHGHANPGVGHDLSRGYRGGARGHEEGSA